MNRTLWIPALVCLLAFVSLCAVFGRAAGVDEKSTVPPIVADASDGELGAASPLSEAESALRVLSDEYAQRWRSWEESPHRMFSRAMVHPVSPMHIEFAVVPPASSGDSFFLGTLHITRQRGEEPEQMIPCVIDSTSRQVRLFHNGVWMTGDEWLQTAPAPVALDTLRG
jgi:hypothetical protein